MIARTICVRVYLNENESVYSIIEFYNIYSISWYCGSDVNACQDERGPRLDQQRIELLGTANNENMRRGWAQCLHKFWKYKIIYLKLWLLTCIISM